MAATGTKKRTPREKAAQVTAVVRTGGKQYKVAAGDTIEVERLQADEGEIVELDQVLLTDDGKKVNVGTPTVSGAKVIAEIIANGKGEKVIAFKYKPKVRYRRMKGHRQQYTRLAIKEVVC